MPPSSVIPGFRAASAIELYPTENLATRTRVAGPSGTYDLSAVYFYCYLRIPGCAVRCYGKFDTGAYVSVIPRSEWMSWPRSAIEWLTLPSAAPISWTRIAGVVGTAVPARLGVVQMCAVDLRFRYLPPVPVIALFALQDINEDQILLGNSHGIAEGRYFVARPDADVARRGAWLCDRPPAFDPTGAISVS